MKQQKYKVVLEVLGEEWKSHGTSILKALQNLKPRYDEIKGKGMLNVFIDGKLKHEHLITMPKIRRILTNKIIKAHWAKNLEYLIKGDNKTNLPKENK